MNKDKFLQKWAISSWEPEILISAGLVLSLFNVRPLLVVFYNVMSPLEIKGMAILLVFLSGIAGILAVGFSLHLILRAYWLMQMGIAYAFGNRLDVKELKFKPVYERRVSKIDVLKNGINSGKTASLIFGINFFLLLVALGLMITVIFGSAVSYFLNLPETIFLALILIVFIDFISLGKLKRTKVGALLYPLFAFFNILLLSFLYRDIYYSLISNVKWYKLYLGLLFFIACFVGLSATNSNKILRLPNPLITDTEFPDYNRSYYEDERDPYSPNLASIDSYNQQSNMMKLFIRRTSISKEAFKNEALHIKIDSDSALVKQIRDYWGSENQSGYLVFIDLRNVSSGTEHLIRITFDSTRMSKEFLLNPTIEFPFYKE